MPAALSYERPKYRKINFRASQTRETSHVVLHPSVLSGLRNAAKGERKSVAWIVEEALAEYFGFRVEFAKTKGTPLPAYRPHVSRVVRRRSA